MTTEHVRSWRRRPTIVNGLQIPWRRLLMISVLLLVLILLGWIVLASGRFIVRDIVVLDARPAVAAEIKDYVWNIVHTRSVLFGKTNIFFVPRVLLERELLKTFPSIHTTQVLRRLPGTVQIAVQEKVPVALLYAGETYYAIDPEGMAFETISPESLTENTLPIVRDARSSADVQLGTSIVDGELLRALHDVITLLPERFHLAVAEVVIPSIGARELHVVTSEEWNLLLDTTRPLLQQFAVLDKVFAEEIDANERQRLEYLDLRVSGKAFYKLRNSHATPR